MNFLHRIFFIFAFSLISSLACLAAQAQANDNAFRVFELEEEIRRLNGRIEEITFELQRTQNNFRLLQEDYELRFQQLEGNAPKSQNENTTFTNPNVENNFIETTDNSLDNSFSANLPSTLHFDEQGNLVESERESRNLKNLTDFDTQDFASFGSTPDEVFAAGKTALEIKSFARSENAFRAFLTQWPTDPRIAEARYYLGQSLFSQRNYFNAANVYLSNHNDYPDASIAPDNLLGLALSLAGLNQRETACVTYGEVLRRYPQAKDRLGERIRAEQSGTRCTSVFENQ